MRKKKAWIIGVGMIILLGVLFMWGIGRQKKETEVVVQETESYKSTYVWPKNDLTKEIPEPKSKNGTILCADDKKLELEIYKISYSEYNAYVRDCRKQGFTVNESKKGIKFTAHNVVGYKVMVTYQKDNTTMYLSIDAEDVKKNVFAEGMYSTYTYKNYLIDIPNDWSVTQTKEGEQLFEIKLDSQKMVVLLDISYQIDDEDPVNLDALYADNDNMINLVESFFDNCKVSEEKEIKSDYGVRGIVYPYAYWVDVDGERLDGKGWYYCFPSPEDNRWFYIHLCEVGEGIEENTYEKEYMKILASIRPKE